MADYYFKKLIPTKDFKVSEESGYKLKDEKEIIQNIKNDQIPELIDLNKEFIENEKRKNMECYSNCVYCGDPIFKIFNLTTFEFEIMCLGRKTEYCGSLYTLK